MTAEEWCLRSYAGIKAGTPDAELQSRADRLAQHAVLIGAGVEGGVDAILQQLIAVRDQYRTTEKHSR